MNKYETVRCLLQAGADRNIRDCYQSDTDARSFECSSILSEALRGEPDWDIVRLLLNSEALCDRFCIDRLYNGGSKAFEMFQELKDHSIVGDQLKYFRQLAIDADLGWDRISGDLTKSKLELSGLSVSYLLFNAARFGRLQVMEKMIPMIAEFDGKDINAVNEEGETALGIACRYSHPEIVKLLMIEGVNVNSVNALGYTPLMTAVEKNSVDCVRTLLQHGADVRVASVYGTTALHLAACHETPRMLEMILQSSTTKGSNLYTRDNAGWSLIHHAASHGWLRTIETILEHFEEASLFDRLQNNSTCLHLAAQSGWVAGVKFFLDCGLSANDYNNDGETPVYSAINSSNSFETIQILHARDADLDIQSAETGDIPLFHVIRRLGPASDADTMRCFDFVLKHTADVNYCDNSGKNCLHWLAQDLSMMYSHCYYQAACLALLQRGCSMNRRNNKGVSPFQTFIERWSQVQSASDDLRIGLYIYQGWNKDNDVNAAMDFEDIRPEIGMTLFILKYVKADPEILGTPESVLLGGASLLTLALRTGYEGAIRQVLEYDSDVDKTISTPDSISPDLQTPLHWLCFAGLSIIKKDLVRSLLSLSRALGRQGPTGLALIHIASKYGALVVLEELLNMGIDADSLSSDARSPLMYACKESQLEAMRLLYEKGARVAVSERHDPIMTACGEGHKEILSTLYDMPELRLHWGRTFKSSFIYYPLATVVKDMTYFHHAAYHSQADVLVWLLEAGLVQDVNSTVGDEGFTALYLAACNELSYDKTLPLLLSKGADVSSRCTTRERTSLHVAAMNGDIQAIEVLLAHGADLSATDSSLSTPYVLALEHNEPHAASRLLERTKAKQNEDRWAQVKGNIGPIDDLSLGKALRRCSRLGQADVVEILLDNGADVNARSRKGTTAVMKASGGGHLEVLDLLKDRGADFLAKDGAGDSALSFACWGLKSLVVPGLLELGLSFTETNYHDNTPLHHYAEGPFNQGFHDVVTTHATPEQLSSSQLATLLNDGLQNEGTPMMIWILSIMDTTQKKDAINNLNYACPSFAPHQASFQGSVEKLEMLLDAGGEIDLRNEKISPPLACAASMGRMEAVQFLAQKGAKLEWSMPDGTMENAIDAAKNYPEVQQWMRTFYKEKEQGLESECGGSDQKALSGIFEGEISEAAGV